MEPMQSLAVVFHRVGVALCLTAFALMFVSANLAGADPLVAMVRAVAGTTVLAVVFGFYIVLALRARALITSPRAVRLVNRGSGVIMAGAAVAIASR